jgi:hypothetical protein
MLRDITITSARINNAIIPCLGHRHKDSKDPKRRVNFDAECTSRLSLLSPILPRGKRLLKAIAGEKKQKERLQETPESALIRSSSTWRELKLERF